MAKRSNGPIPSLIVAGPGAGKTHRMVEEIVACVPRLNSSRFLAAITYTNAAAEVIRSRLYRQIQPSRNIFVGTIHSFLSRFILGPYASLLGELPEDSLFMAVELDALGKSKGKAQTGKNKAITRNVIISALVKKGIVPYDQMGAISAALIEKPHIRKSIGTRLQFLFVDEFQDVDTTQLRVFECMRQEGRTVMFAVGDPEQYISGFTYGQRCVPSPKYLKIPFFRFAEKANRSEWSENHRSCSEIVTFTNNFHSHLTQQSLSGSRGCPRVFVLPDTAMPEIVERFRDISDKQHCGKHTITRLYLGLANATYDDVREQYGLVSVSNSSVSHRSALSDTLDVVAKLLGMSQTRIRDLWGLNILEWRKLGIRVLRQLRSGGITTQEQVQKFVDAALPAAGQVERKYTPTSEIATLLDIIRSDSCRHENERCSSIHKAKGLEADAVLVVARTAAELCKWIETDGSRRAEDGTDSCRVGFVAFSRAKDVLCIACKKSIPDETKQLLAELGATVISEVKT